MSISEAGQPFNRLTQFNSTVNPNFINIPNIPQTTSHDIDEECTNYTFPVPIDLSEWPTRWKIATSNDVDDSDEFNRVYNAIDWSLAPDIPIRSVDDDGKLDTSDYDEDKDPDCWWSSTNCVTPKHPGILHDIYRCPEPETWGLSFDDGPICSHNAFYDFLLQNNVKASFFYIGSNVLSWPYGAQRGLKDGHHIAVHTWSHQLMTTLENDEALAELYYTMKIIKLVTGVTPRYWRAPFGDQDDRIRWIASQLGLTSISWNLDTKDGDVKKTTVNKVQGAYDDYIQMGKNGTFESAGNIVLSHEINNTTMSLMMKNYANIKNAYKHVVDVATCMNLTNPYFESDWHHPVKAASKGESESESKGESKVEIKVESKDESKDEKDESKSKKSALFPSSTSVSINPNSLSNKVRASDLPAPGSSGGSTQSGSNLSSYIDLYTVLASACIAFSTIVWAL